MTISNKVRIARENGRKGGRPKGTLGQPYSRPKFLTGEQTPEKYLQADFRRRYYLKKDQPIKDLRKRQENVCPKCKGSLSDHTTYGRPVVHHLFSVERFAKTINRTNFEEIALACNDPKNLQAVHHGCNIALGIEDRGGWDAIHPNGNT